jgi:hypothetical protein
MVKLSEQFAIGPGLEEEQAPELWSEVKVGLEVIVGDKAEVTIVVPDQSAQVWVIGELLRLRGVGVYYGS